MGDFHAASAHFPEPWRQINFDDDIPATQYTLRNWDGVNAVSAVAEASMALLARPLSVDLANTPMLCWRWRIESTVGSADLRRKSGDDYAARVYVAFAIPTEQKGFGLRSKLKLGRMLFGDQVPDAAINYVWDNLNPIGTRAPNAYTDRTQIIVTRSGNGDAGKWQSERRNVLSDAHSAFPNVDLSTVSLAIGSDTDNTGETVRAGFAELHFVGSEEPCEFTELELRAEG